MPTRGTLALADRPSEVALVLEAVTEMMRGQRELLDAVQRIERSIDELRMQVEEVLPANAFPDEPDPGQAPGSVPAAHDCPAVAVTGQERSGQVAVEHQEAHPEETHQEPWRPPSEEELLRELERVVASGLPSEVVA